MFHCLRVFVTSESDSDSDDPLCVPPHLLHIEPGTNPTSMIPHSVSNAMHGARGGTRGVGRKHSRGRPTGSTAERKGPAQRATPTRLTHCNYSSSVIRWNTLLTKYMGLVVALPIVSARLHWFSFDSRSFIEPGPSCRVTRAHGEVRTIPVEYDRSTHPGIRRIDPDTPSEATFYPWGYVTGEHAPWN